MDLDFIRADIEQRRRQIARQRREILDLHRSRTSAEELLMRMIGDDDRASWYGEGCATRRNDEFGDDPPLNGCVTSGAAPVAGGLLRGAGSNIDVTRCAPMTGLGDGEAILGIGSTAPAFAKAPAKRLTWPESNNNE